MKPGIESVVQNGENSLYSAGKIHIGRQFPTSSSFFFLNYFYPCFTPCFLEYNFSCFNNSLIIGFIVSFRLIFTGLDVFGSGSIVVAGFASLEILDCCLNFFINDLKVVLLMLPLSLFFFVNSFDFKIQGILNFSSVSSSAFYLLWNSLKTFAIFFSML